ncbi:MAG: hypothetical protein WDO73_01375 [Ignavibacteriota bacterium]
MWFSAINELLQFFFGIVALWCWQRGGKMLWAGLPLFALALLSKESALIVLTLFVLVGERRPGLRLVPYVALAAIAVASVAASRDVSFRFSDGSFSLHAPFWNHMAFQLSSDTVDLGPRGNRRHSPGARPRSTSPRRRLAWLWIGIGLIPYSFLTYSTEFRAGKAIWPALD